MCEDLARDDPLDGNGPRPVSQHRSPCNRRQGVTIQPLSVTSKPTAQGPNKRSLGTLGEPSSEMRWIGLAKTQWSDVEPLAAHSHTGQAADLRLYVLPSYGTSGKRPQRRPR